MLCKSIYAWYKIFTRVHFHSIFNENKYYCCHPLTRKWTEQSKLSGDVWILCIHSSSGSLCGLHHVCVYVHVCGYTLYISILWLLQALQCSGLVVTCGGALHPPLPFLFSFFETVFATPWFFPDVSCVYLSLSYCSGSFISRRKTQTLGQPKIFSDSFLWRSSRGSCVFPHAKIYWKTGTLIKLFPVCAIWALYSAPNQKLYKLSFFWFYRNASTTVHCFLSNPSICGAFGQASALRWVFI